MAAEDDITASPVGTPGSGATLLSRYIAGLNRGVRSGDFASMLAELTDDAQLVFEGIPVGPFRGREAIGAAYRLQPPDGELELLGVDEDGHGGASGSYAWSERPGVVAGEVHVTARGGALLACWCGTATTADHDRKAESERGRRSANIVIQR